MDYIAKTPQVILICLLSCMFPPPFTVVVIYGLTVHSGPCGMPLKVALTRSSSASGVLVMARRLKTPMSHRSLAAVNHRNAPEVVAVVVSGCVEFICSLQSLSNAPPRFNSLLFLLSSTYDMQCVTVICFCNWAGFSPWWEATLVVLAVIHTTRKLHCAGKSSIHCFIHNLYSGVPKTYNTVHFFVPFERYLSFVLACEEHSV